MFRIILNGFVLGLVASPSCPSNAEEVRVGTLHGFRGALLVATGAVAGDAAVLGVVLLGLHPVMAAFPALTAVLWLFGAVILAYIGLDILRDARRTEGVAQAAPAADSPAGSVRPFWAGFAITTFNPFTILWWVGLLAPALERNGSIVPFAVAVLAGALSWFVALAVILRAGRRWLTTRVRRAVLVVSGVAVLVYSGYFAWRAIDLLPDVI